MSFLNPSKWVTEAKKKPPKDPTTSTTPAPGTKSQAPSGYTPVQTHAVGTAPAAPPAPPSRATKAHRAETRQKALVNRFVTQALKQKVSKARKELGPQKVGQLDLNERVEKAKHEVNNLRERLLNHPKVEEANATGKVVPLKGLAQIHQHDVHLHAIEGPRGVSYSKRFGFQPRSLLVGSKGAELLQRKSETPKGLGSAGRTRERAKEKIHERSEPSTVEDLAYASLGVPGIGVGGDLVNLASLGLKALPEVATREGASALASRAATKVAEDVGTKASKLARLPGKAAEAVRAAPSAAREIPQALRESPAALKAGAKALPKATGKAALKSGETAYSTTGGLAVLGGAHKAGLNLPGGAIIEGQGKAIGKDPLKVLSSTANIAPGLLVSALQLPAAAGASVVQGNPGPLEGALKEQGNFFKHFAETYGSDNAKKIEEATLKEGLLPEVILAPLMAKLGKEGGHLFSSKVFSPSEAIKARRAPLMDENGNVLTHEHGGPVKRGSQRHPNEAKLTRHGENNHLRREEARHAGTTEDLVNVEFGRRAHDVEKAARKAAGQKVEVRTGLGPKGKDTLHARPTDFIPFLNRAAIDLHNPEAALAEINHYHEQFKGLPPTRDYGANPALLNARDAVAYFRAHPEALKNKHLADMLENYRDMANGKTGLDSLSTSDRNRYLAAAKAHGILDANERIPFAAREHTDAKDRAGAFADLAERDKQIEAQRRVGHEKKVQARVVDKNTTRGKQLRRESKAAYAKAKALKKDREAFHEALVKVPGSHREYTRPGAKPNRNSKRLAYDEPLENEMVAETKAMLEKRGLHTEPAYVPDVSVVARAKPDQTATGGQKALPAGPQINEGYVWQHGLQQQGYEHLMNSTMRSVAAHHWYENGRRFRDERHIDYKGIAQHDGKTWAEAFQHGVMNEKDVVLVPTQALNRLERAMQGGTPSDYAKASAALTEEAVKGNQGVAGTKYEAYPMAAYKEFAAQAQKAPVAQWLRSANMVTSRAMLSTPSFIAAQVVAETMQAVADTNPVRMAEGLLRYSKLDPAQKARISGVSGETGKAIFSADRLGNALLHEGKPMEDALSFFRRNLFGRSMKSVVSMKWAGEVNRYTSGLTRRAVLTGEIMKELNGLQAHGRKLLDMQTEFQRETKGMTGKQKMAWAADHPKFLDKMQKEGLHPAMGGWNNLTRTGHFPEVYRAAGLVFYPFLRMSVLWPIKYAAHHPIKATALAYLAAQNNFALREALHGEPSFLNYAQIPIYGTNPKTGKVEATSTINLARMSPGGNALSQAAQGTGSPVGALQPVIAAALLGATGQGSLGPVEGGTGAHIKASIASILSLSPYLRAADTLRGQKATGESEFGLLAKRANINADAFAALEAKLKGPLATQIVRSLGNPLQPEPIGLARDKAKLGRIIETLSANSTSSQAKVENRAKVVKMQKAKEKGEKELEGLYKKYGVSGSAKRGEESWKYNHPYPGESEKSSPFGSHWGSSGSAFEGGWGSSEKKPKPVPFESNGISIPGLPNLGGVTGAISSLFGGEKASAAELNKKPAGKAPKVPNIEGFEHQDQKEFAQWFSHYSKIPPKLAGEWVKQEGGGFSNGGEAGKNNWLGVGYPARPTPFSESHYFNGSPKKAAKATAEWIEGKIGGKYGYEAAASIQKISQLAKSGATEAQIRSYIEGPSAWGTGTIAQSGIAVNGKTAANVPKRVMTKFKAGFVAAKELNKAQLPYVWGGGHVSGKVHPTGGGLDCSGTVSYVLQKMGVKLPGGVVSGEMGHYLKPGPGAVTVFYNSEHTFMKIGNKYFGTSESNPSGGAGFFPTSVGKGEVAEGNSAGSYSVGHVSGLGKKVAVQLGIPLTSGSGSSSFPGMTLSSNGTTATITGPSATQTKAGFSDKPIKAKKLSAAQRLKLVEQVTSGNLQHYGIPASEPSAPTPSALADLGKSLEEQRKKLVTM